MINRREFLYTTTAAALAAAFETGVARQRKEAQPVPHRYALLPITREPGK